MKRITIALAFVGFATSCSFGQFGYTEPVTNGEKSEYQFTKIAHLGTTPVQSQGHTGTCWSFSALSFFESELIRMGNENPDLLSEMYIVRKSYEGKAEKYIRMDGKINFSEGGAFHDIPYVIRNYGIVPLEVYNGLNYGSERHNHSELFSVLDGAVQGLLGHLKNRRTTSLTSAWKTALNGILDAYLGKDVKEFEFKGKKFTPKSYVKEIGLEMDDYLSLTSFTHHEMNKECMLAIPDNWAWGKSYNVSLDDLMEACEYALKEGYTLAWGADVSEKGFSFGNGLAINPVDENTIEVSGRDNKNFSDAGADKKSNAFKTPVPEVKITPEIRQEGYDNKTTTDDHGMHIVGIYKDQKGTKYFLVKNSWGTGNYPKGYLYVSESYFKWKTINVYLHKDGISKSMKKKLGL
ncbi:MAG: aminopeptidase [Crocinitomicaceae bacterium]|nr:aminopeptidase [Crocinitomicaceae bacterium]